MKEASETRVLRCLKRGGDVDGDLGTLLPKTSSRKCRDGDHQ